MALTKVNQAYSNITNAITIESTAANTLLYTVPKGKYFEGFVTGNGNGNTQNVFVNGSEVARFDRNSTYYSENNPVYFMEGDVVSSSTSNFYFTLSGLERSL